MFGDVLKREFGHYPQCSGGTIPPEIDDYVGQNIVIDSESRVLTVANRKRNQHELGAYIAPC